MGALAGGGLLRAAPGRECLVGRLDQSRQGLLAGCEEQHRWRCGVCGKVGVAPAVEEEVVVAAQPVELLVRAVGAVVLDQHRETLIADVADQRCVGLQIARPAAPGVHTRAGRQACRLRALWLLCGVGLDTSAAVALPVKGHAIEHRAGTWCRSGRGDQQDDGGQLQVVLGVADARDLCRV